MNTFARSEELRFLLFDLLEVETLADRPRYDGQDRDIWDAALTTAEQIAVLHFAPHNREADLNEPRLVDGAVQTVSGVKPALDAFADAGFLHAHHDDALGGLQLPWAVVQGCFTFFQAANISTVAYPFLTIAAGNLLARFASDEQKARFLPPMLSGRFFGTMCLSEPQAGSSLTDITTSARPTEDGHYAISGVKQWISGGEHELSDNIVHLVLARIEGAPPGVKGLSLFIVPRFRLDAAGEPAAANDVHLVSLLHKMGYRGTTSTILRFGENDACEGELIGEANRGLTYMFQMMNEARIGVGLGAAMLAHAGYVHSLDYARNRPQGRHPGGKDPAAPPVAIIEHADVKRMLLAQRAYAEGGMALCLHAAKLMDDERTAPPDQAANASLLLDVLTPVCKAWPSEWGPRANDLAIQIMGGYGYTRDYPVEQYYRDNRLNPIHEGTNGIQALDLLGRKLAMSDGRGLDLLSEEIRSTCATASDDEVLRRHADALATHLDSLVHTSALLLARMQAGDINLALANASLHLDAMGQVVIAWQWLRQAIVAQRMLSAGNGDPDYLQGKVQVCHYFFRYELPRVSQLTELLNQIDTTCADTPASWF